MSTCSINIDNSELTERQFINLSHILIVCGKSSTAVFPHFKVYFFRMFVDVPKYAEVVFKIWFSWFNLYGKSSDETNKSCGGCQ